MNSTDKTIIVAIISLGFSGSMLVNYVLGSHLGVFEASEIYALLHHAPDMASTCSWCGEECPV
ncbi:MAG: hypothetical protein ABIK45_06360 [Pseudomonadota bacterium]